MNGNGAISASGEAITPRNDNDASNTVEEITQFAANGGVDKAPTRLTGKGIQGVKETISMNGNDVDKTTSPMNEKDAAHKVKDITQYTANGGADKATNLLTGKCSQGVKEIISMNGNDADVATTRLDSKSILSDTYVPERFRIINTLNAFRLFAEPIDSVFPQTISIRADVVPFTPDMYQSPIVFPLRTCAPGEDYYYYAIQQRENGIRPKESPLPRIADVASLTLESEKLQNYCKTFMQLIRVERQHVLELFERYSQYNYSITTGTVKEGKRELNVAAIEIPGIADARPIVQPGDSVLLRTMSQVSLPKTPELGYQLGTYPPATIEVQSTIRSIQRQDGKVSIAWLNSLTSNTLKIAYKGPDARFNVRFVPSSEKDMRCMSALDWLSQQPAEYVMPLLFPTNAPTLPHDDSVMSSLMVAHDATDRAEVDDDELNLQQRDFVSLVLRRTKNPDYQTIRGPNILTGPAGTGKTRTMLSALVKVLQLGGDHRILVCTPSHTAADVITQRLGKKLSRVELFRLYDSNRPIATVPVDVLRFSRQSEASGALCLPPCGELMKFKVIVCTCEDSHLLYRAGVTNQQIRVRRADFAKYLRKACGECNLVVSLDGVKDPHFSHLFMDEAAQATEPESLIPLSVVV
jgi:hypothetical protein